MAHTPYEEKGELFNLVARFGLFETASPLLFAAAPSSWQWRVEESHGCLKRGDYLRAAKILTMPMEEDGRVYAQLADVLFKIEACAGLIGPAETRLDYLSRRARAAGELRVAAQYEFMLARFRESFESERSLRSYLSDASGNDDYTLTESYLDLKAKLQKTPSSRTANARSSRADGENTEVRQTDSVLVSADSVIHAQRSIPFTLETTWVEVGQIVTGLIHDSDAITGKKLLHRSAEPYPESWAENVLQAVDLKRRGKFLASAQIYDEISRSSGVLYTGVIAALYKTTAASGALLSANFLLLNGQKILESDPKAVRQAAQVGTSSFEDHLSRLLGNIASERELEAYLRDICGNVNYKLSRDFDEAVSELTEHYARMQRRFEKISKAEAAGKSGCYIATAVYGSYDASPVLTLRQFRDERLATTSYGRAFIRFYYAASPPIARRLQRASWLNKRVKSVLEILVRRLESRGVPKEN